MKSAPPSSATQPPKDDALQRDCEVAQTVSFNAWSLSNQVCVY